MPTVDLSIDRTGKAATFSNEIRDMSTLHCRVTCVQSDAETLAREINTGFKTFGWYQKGGLENWKKANWLSRVRRDPIDQKKAKVYDWALGRAEGEFLAHESGVRCL